MYWRTPPGSATIVEAYWAGSVHSWLCQMTLPVFLSSAASVPSFPPGVQIKRSPSIRTDSAKPQPGMVPPSSCIVFFQTTFPSATCGPMSLGGQAGGGKEQRGEEGIVEEQFRFHVRGSLSIVIKTREEPPPERRRSTLFPRSALPRRSLGGKAGSDSERAKGALQLN